MSTFKKTVLHNFKNLAHMATK